MAMESSDRKKCCCLFAAYDMTFEFCARDRNEGRVEAALLHGGDAKRAARAASIADSERLQVFSIVRAATLVEEDGLMVVNRNEDGLIDRI